MNRFKNIINSLVHMGNENNELYAALIIGFQARKNHPADEYSDLNIILIVDNPDSFLYSDQWLV